MTTTTHPDVPLPAGAHVLTDWDQSAKEDGEKYRVISTDIEMVEGTDVGVSIDAVQWPDGSFANEPLARPTVRVDRRSISPQFTWSDCLELSTAGARQLARALIAAADQLDGWAR